MVDLMSAMERLRECDTVTDWVTIDTSTEEGGGVSEVRASWMVLTQLNGGVRVKSR